MRHLANLLFVLVIFTTQAFADEWPAAAKRQMEAAGGRLNAATTTAQRVQALEEIEAIATTYPDAPGARATAAVIGARATMEAGPGEMLAALGELAASGRITDINSYARIAAPFLETAAKMHKDGTLLPETAIKLDDAVRKLNAAAAKAGLPSVADAISRVLGDDKSGSLITGMLSRAAKLARTARDSPDLADMNKDATKKYIDNAVGILPPGAGPAINGPAFVVFRDSLAWNNEMFGQSTNALNLVGDAIETGQFDHAAYNKIHDRINELANKGPWDGDTARDFFGNLCKSIPVAGKWCAEAFKATDKLTNGNTAASGGLPRLSGEWVYLGRGEATIVQERNYVRMILTWTPSSVPGPHYSVIATLSGNFMKGNWRLISENNKSPSLLLGGHFEAEAHQNGDSISVSNTEDNGHGWNGIVLTRRRASE